MKTPRLKQQFLEVYDRHAEAVFRHCFFRVYDRALAEELMQEAFTKAWHYLAEGKKVQNLRAFVYTVANNLIIDISRKKSELSLEALQEQGWDAASNRDDLITQTDAALVLSHFSRLDEEYRAVVYMRYVDNLKPKEIAEILGVSANVVSVRIHRGMQQLKTLINSSVKSV